MYFSLFFLFFYFLFLCFFLIIRRPPRSTLDRSSAASDVYKRQAQLDRFLLHVRVDYPSESEERLILQQTTGVSEAKVPQVMQGDAIRSLQKLVREVHVSDDLLNWILSLIHISEPTRPY